MRKIFLSLIGVAFVTIGFAQTSETLKTGVIIEVSIVEIGEKDNAPIWAYGDSAPGTVVAGSVAAGAFGGPAAASAVSALRGIVQDDVSGILYEVLPTSLKIEVGSPVIFKAFNQMNQSIIQNIR